MRKPQPSLAQRLFLGNLRNKGTSLVFAILIWVFAFSNTKQFDTIEVDVRIVAASDGKVVLELREESESGAPFTGVVSLTLEGPRNLLAQTLEDHKDTAIDGEVSVSESATVFLGDSAIYGALPAGISVVRSEPSQVHVQLDDLVVREIPIVRSPAEFRPSALYAVPKQSDFTYEPTRISVRGPSTLLDSVKARLQKIVVSDYNRPEYDEELEVVLEGSTHPQVRFAPGVTPRVRVRVTLQSALQERGFEVPVFYAWSRARDPGPFELSIGDSEVGMTCKGSPKALEELDRRVRDGEFRILIFLEDFSGAPGRVTSDKFTWPADALPSGIDLRSIEFKNSIVYVVNRIGEGTDPEEP